MDRIVLKIKIAGDAVDHPWSDDLSLPATQLQDFDDTPLPQRVFNLQGGFQIDAEQYSGETKDVTPLEAAETEIARMQDPCGVARRE